MHDMSMMSAPPPDSRQVVSFPDPIRTHILANMRDHLTALQRLQAELAEGRFERAAEIAEQSLGMSSLKMHGADVAAPYMPPAMQAIGTEMHHAASRFAMEATNAAATGDMRAPLKALAAITAQCVACHSGFRVR